MPPRKQPRRRTPSPVTVIKPDGETQIRAASSFPKRRSDPPVLAAIQGPPPDRTVRLTTTVRNAQKSLGRELNAYATDFATLGEDQRERRRKALRRYAVTCGRQEQLKQLLARTEAQAD